MHDGMPYGRIQGQGQGHEPIQGSRIENLQSREVDRQSPMGLIFLVFCPPALIPNSKGNPFSGDAKVGGKNLRFSTEIGVYLGNRTS